MCIMDNYKTIEADLDILQKSIGYKFSDESLLKTALTHSSAVNETGAECNERLEFLGDAVLQLCVSTDLYKLHRSDDEGALSKLRALIVCADSLSVTSKKIDLDKFLIMGKGEEHSGGRQKKNILADALESLIAAIYLDGGYEEAIKFVRTKHGDIISEALDGHLKYDYKTMLQEYVQANKLGELTYELVDVSGPEHDRTFTSVAIIGGKKFSPAKAHNKKQSEHNAASNALKALKATDGGKNI